MNKPNVAFICVHNSCRSQMAESISKVFAADVFNAYSAGTELKDKINPDAVAVIKELYSVDIERTQCPKLLEELPEIDVVVTMGCNVECPYIPSKSCEDWGIEDPSGKSKEDFIKATKVIEIKVKELMERISNIIN